MTNTTELAQVKRATESTIILKEFAKLEFEQAIESFRSGLSLFVQIVAVLIIADGTIVGYALTTQIASVLLIGSIFPIAILFLIHLGRRAIVPIIYSALSIERNYGDCGADLLVSTFVAFTNSTEYVTELLTIGSIQDSKERFDKLQTVSRPWFRTGRPIGRIALVLVAVGHIIGPIILARFFNWRFF